MNNKVLLFVLSVVGAISIVASVLCFGVVVSFFVMAKNSGGIVWYIEHNPAEIRPNTAFFMQGIYFLLHGVGTLLRRKWAKILTLLLPVSILLTFLIGELQSSSISFSLVLTAYLIFVIFLITRAEIREQFI